MSETTPTNDIGKKIAAGSASIDEITEFVSTLMPNAVNQVNLLFSPRQLVKRDRSTEPLPTNSRQLSSYRTRIGTMLEYALSTHIDNAIKSLFDSDLRLTFAVAHEYPDFYIRDSILGPQVRIEMKAVDADSEEQAARFEVLSSLIQGEKDVVLLIGWEWRTGVLDNSTACEYPKIFSFIAVPAAELAGERDKSVVLRGGRIEATRIMVPKRGRPSELVPDQGNAGKILRLVHYTRKAEPFNLSKYIQQYLGFASEIERRTGAR